MNQEQVDAMCPEDRGEKRGGFEAVLSREGVWNLVVVRDQWTRCLSIQGGCPGGVQSHDAVQDMSRMTVARDE